MKRQKQEARSQKQIRNTKFGTFHKHNLMVSGLISKILDFSRISACKFQSFICSGSKAQIANRSRNNEIVALYFSSLTAHFSISDVGVLPC